MIKNWGIQRKKGRVALAVPIIIEVIKDKGSPMIIDTVADDISRDGFRMSLDESVEKTVLLEAGKEYRVVIMFGSQKINGLIKIMWKSKDQYGVHFVQRDKGWIVS